VGEEMAGYSQDVIEDLRQSNDIIDVISQYVQLKQAGANHMGLCPFHREKSPSFSVSSQKQLFHCFGCGVSGNVFSFVMKIENFGFMDAIKFLADRINFVLPPLGNASSTSVVEKNEIFEAYKLAARYYYDILQSAEGREAVAYLDERRITQAARRKFGLGVSAYGGLGQMLGQKGYDENFLVRAGLIMEGKNGHYDRFRNRLMFPIFDVSGKVISFGGRILGEGQPKYMNSPETPIFDKSRTLYGLNYARLSKSDVIVLVEGYMDVIALHQVGIKNTVAALGTAFTPNHARILKRYCKQVIVLFDGDAAGTAATLRAVWHLYAAGLTAKVATLPGAKDPDDYIINFGAQSLMDRLNNSEDFVEYQIDTIRKKYDLDVTAQRVAFSKEVTEILGRLNTAIEQDAYVRDVSMKYGIDQSAVKEEISKQAPNDGVFPVEVKKPKRAGPNKALPDALSHILYSMAQNEGLCGAITSWLISDEMGDFLYTKLYEAIVATRLRGVEVHLSNIITALEDPEHQQAAAAMFANVAEYENMDAQRTALEHQIKLVKVSYLEQQIDGLDKNRDFEKLSHLSQELKRLRSLKISL